MIKALAIGCGALMLSGLLAMLKWQRWAFRALWLRLKRRR